MSSTYQILSDQSVIKVEQSYSLTETDLSCETENQVLSDVHVHLPGQSVCVNNINLTESRFFFKLPVSLSLTSDGQNICSTSVEAGMLASSNHANTRNRVPGDEKITGACDLYEYDEDGDLIVKRVHIEDSKELVITVVHAMATDLDLVGQQVWLGALLLCDFMLHYSALLKGAVVVDLGAGVGLTSIVAAIMAKTVFCTDRGDDVLRLANLNVDHNSHLLQNGDVRVREMDWKAKAPLEADSEGSSKRTEPFSLSRKDAETLRACSIILAAEVVYDHEITDAFFSLLYHLLLEQPAKVVYMTVEKRQVFTIVDREVVSPAYEHFRENLRDLCSIDEGPVRFVCSQVDTSFPQYFHYQRTKELELWKIETVFLYQ